MRFFSLAFMLPSEFLIFLDTTGRFIEMSILSNPNQELEEMSKGENIVKWIKGQRISWLGHLERMGEDRMPKKIFTQELEGTR